MTPQSCCPQICLVVILQGCLIPSTVSNTYCRGGNDKKKNDVTKGLQKLLTKLPKDGRQEGSKSGKKEERKGMYFNG